MKHTFVSSTFKGMHSEREIIQKNIIPKLTKKANEYGEYIEYIDLRWECDLEDVMRDYMSSKILKNLKEEINVIKPYVLVFQGEYKEDDDILFGEYEKCILCVKESDEVEMSYLKKKLGERLITYKAIEEIKERPEIILEKITDMFDDRIKETSLFSWQEKEMLGYKTYINETTSFFKKINNSIISLDKLPTTFSVKLNIENINQFAIGCYQAKEKQLERYYELIDSEESKLFVFLGENGCGKSTMFANVVKMLEKNKKNVFPFVCGYSVRSMTAEDLLKQMVYFLEDKLNVENPFSEMSLSKEEQMVEVDFLDIEKDNDIKKIGTSLVEENEDNLLDNIESKLNTFKDWKDYFGKLLIKYDEKYSTSFMIVIDAVEQFSDNELEKLLSMIPFAENNNLKCVMFGQENMNFDVFRQYEGITTAETFEELTPRELGDISEGVLRANGIKLDNRVIDSLLKKRGAKNPLYIKLLMYYLVMACKEISNIPDRKKQTRYLMDLIENQTSGLEKFANIAIRKSAAKFDTKLITDIISLIAVSRNGLRESDIAYILKKDGKFNKKEFIQFVNYMSIWFILKEDGRYDFSHKAIKNSIKNSLPNADKYEKLILDRMKNLEFGDELRLYDGMYHAYNVSDKTFVVNQMELACIEEEDKIVIISSAIKQMCYMDEGKWLCEIVKDSDVVSDKSVIIPYLLHDFKTVFEDNDMDNTIRMNLMTELILRMKKIYREDRCIPNHLNLTSSYKRIGDLYRTVGEVQKAIECYKVCIKHSLEIYKEDSNAIEFNEIMENYGILGDMFMEQKQLEDAQKYYKIFLGSALKNFKRYHSLANLKIVGKSYKRMGILFKEVENYDSAKEAFDKFIKCMKKVCEIDKDDMASRKEEMLGYYLMGEINVSLNDYTEALLYYDNALKCSKKICNMWNNITNQKDVARSYGRIGNIYAEIGKLEESLMYQEKNLKHLEKIYNKRRDLASLKELSISCGKTAEAYLKLEEFESALEYYRCSLEYAKEINIRQNDVWTLHDVSLAQEMIGYVYSERELYYESLECYIIALNYKEQCIYMSNNNVSIIQSISLSCDKIAFLYDKLHDLDKAGEFYERELSYEKQLYENNNFVDSLKAIVFCYSKLGNIYTRKCDYGQAVKCYKRELECMDVINLQEENVDNISELVVCYGSLGEIFFEQKNYEKALYYYQNELSCIEKVFIYQNEVYILQSVADKCERIGDIYTMLGRHETALEYYKREFLYTADIYQLAPDVNVIKNMTICCNILGDVYDRLNIPKEAVKYYKKGVECGSKLRENVNVEMQDIEEILYYAMGKINDLEKYLK